MANHESIRRRPGDVEGGNIRPLLSSPKRRAALSSIMIDRDSARGAALFLTHLIHEGCLHAEPGSDGSIEVAISLSTAQFNWLCEFDCSGDPDLEDDRCDLEPEKEG